MQLYDKRQGCYVPFILWAKQREFLDLIHNQKRIIILKKRQTGMSQLTGADSLAQCMSNDNFTVLVLSKSGDDAKEYLNRVREMYESLPDIIRNACPLNKDTQEEITFMNKSRIKSLAANKGAGYTADRVVIDEAAFITLKESHIDLETVLKRVEPTLDKAEGQLILISTANGMNTFHEYYMNSKQNKSSFIPFFFSCYDDPTFNEAKRLQIVDDHGTDHANQEYPRSETEAFLSSGRKRFDVEKLQSIEIIKGDIKNYYTYYSKKHNKGQYLSVSDVAEGLAKKDYSVNKIFDRISQKQVCEWRGHIEPYDFGIVISNLAKEFNNAIVVIESNNHGHSTLASVKQHYMTQLIFEHDMLFKEKTDDDYNKPNSRYGWRTTASTKPIIIDNLANGIVNNKIYGLSREDKDEMFTYVIESNGSTNAESGYFDDRVMVWAIAHYLMNNSSFNYHYPIRQNLDTCSKCNNYNNQICRLVNAIKDANESCHMFKVKVANTLAGYTTRYEKASHKDLA